MAKKWVYNGYRTAFDGGHSWSFVSASAGNVKIFDAGKKSSSHTDNRKNKFLILGEGATFSIHRRFGSPKKRFSINFSKTRTRVYWSLHYDGDNRYLFVTGQEI